MKFLAILSITMLVVWLLSLIRINKKKTPKRRNENG